jgi:hypothetical protein
VDKCLSNGEIIRVFEIVKDKEKEADIKNQGRCRKLICADLDCSEPVIYRKGNKTARFSHLKSTPNCAYDKYDSDMPDEIRKLKLSVFERLNEIGCNLAIDIKILPNHYTPIIIKLENGKNHAIEFAGKNISANKLQELKKSYNDCNLSVEWITVDSLSMLENEKDANNIKRFQLNESENHTAILYDKDTAGLAVISFDENEYQDSSNMFVHKFSVAGLIFSEGNLSALDFKENFDKWIEKRSEKS